MDEPLAPFTLRCLERGRALYNRGEHYDAHEAWEEAWQEESGEPRLLLQGLIQVAAALHKALVQRQPASCVKLFTMALEKLAPLPAGVAGLQLGRFRDDAARALAHAERWARGEVSAFDPAQTPFLALAGEHVGPPR